ncbi:hypothetical protein OPV22_020038 [Ensete ventricosum]|uniref:Uncharacterized protein n=1 Tax=Ensete ventricosum TaxID=4639 RepID=A0AAV8PBR1_ENSVE|nr:hypothetical protein OPV22_020038 [Ensete ventricosum]
MNWESGIAVPHFLLELEARRHWLHDQIPPYTNKFGSCRTIFLIEPYVTGTAWNIFSSFSRKCTQPCT